MRFNLHAHVCQRSARTHHISRIRSDLTAESSLLCCFSSDTTFEYSNFRLNSSSVSPCDTVGATVDVQNTGSVVSDEVVQLYIQTPTASVPSPQVRLADFHRVRELLPGSKITVNLIITPQYLSVIQNEGKDNFWCETVLRATRCCLYARI